MISSFNPNSLNYKLLLIIVRKGKANKINQAAKEAGSTGATILYGTGTGIHEQASFLGIRVEPEKEIILTLVPTDQLETILAVISKEANMDKPGTGIGIVINATHISGIAHLLGVPIIHRAHDGEHIPAKKELDNKMDNKVLYDLIVTVVNQGFSETVVEATKRAGAEGGTILFGRGTGIHEQAKLFSIHIEPEKELVLTLIDREKTSAVLEAIMEDAELNKPGKGIAFVLPVDRTVGINHVINRMVKDRHIKGDE
jgi:nitrogen regulatory protein PII